MTKLPAAAPFALQDIFDQLFVIFRIGIAVLACYVVFRAFKGKLSDSMTAVVVLLIGCFVWGIMVLFQSGAGNALTSKLAGILG